MKESEKSRKVLKAHLWVLSKKTDLGQTGWFDLQTKAFSNILLGAAEYTIDDLSCPKLQMQGDG
jgi:hypothetical protein